MLPCEQMDIEAAAKVSAALALPAITADRQYSDGERFDPWALFPALYGIYSGDFDVMAIEVLEDVRDGTHKRSDLAAEMFREMLCVASLCDYGTSPRVCFPTSEFAPLLPTLIQRWKEYSDVQWSTTEA